MFPPSQNPGGRTSALHRSKGEWDPSLHHTWHLFFLNGLWKTQFWPKFNFWPLSCPYKFHEFVCLTTTLHMWLVAVFCSHVITICICTYDHMTQLMTIVKIIAKSGPVKWWLATTMTYNGNYSPNCSHNYNMRDRIETFWSSSTIVRGAGAVACRILPVSFFLKINLGKIGTEKPKATPHTLLNYVFQQDTIVSNIKSYKQI